MTGINKTQVWNDSMESIKVSVSPAIFSTWFSQTHLSSINKKEGGYVAKIGCSSSFVKSTIEGRYFGLIQDSLKKTLDTDCDLIFIVKESPKNKGTTKSKTPAPLFEQEERMQEEIGVNLSKARIRPGFTFENYAVSSSNQMAWAAAEAVSKDPGSSYNPLFIWGGVGVGKTHLMNAVGHHLIGEGVDGKILFCTGEEFTNEIVEGIRKKTTMEFRNKYRKLKILIIERTVLSFHHSQGLFCNLNWNIFQ